MKKIVISIFMILMFGNTYSQILPTKFIQLSQKVGYVIDEEERNACRCLSFIPGRDYIYSALVQLPDSQVQLRVKLVNVSKYRSVNLDSKKIQAIHTLLAGISSGNNDSLKEQMQLAYFRSDSINYNFIPYASLQIPTFLSEHDSRSNDIGEVNEKQPLRKFFINAGFGFGGYRNYSTGSMVLELNSTLTERSFLSLRLLAGSELNLTIGSTPPPSVKIQDLGFMYGRLQHFRSISLSISSGMVIMHGVDRREIYQNYSYQTDYEIKTFKRIAVPINAEILFGSRNNFNVSFALNASITSRFSYYSANFCLRFGQVNSKHQSKDNL